MFLTNTRAARGGTDHQEGTKAILMRTPPHPLEEALLARVRLLATTLRPSSVDNYRYTARLFMAYLRQHFPEIRRASQLRRDPHMLGWLEYLWTQRVNSTNMPLAASSRAGHLLRLRKLFELMADHYFPPRPGLRGVKISRGAKILCRDRCHQNRMLPLAEGTTPPATPLEFLLPRPKGREELGIQLRNALLEAASQCGITAHIVPYQLRHTFATSMLRAGVSLPALMKLLGHKKANMTLRYVEITQLDLQRELDLVRLNPRHLVPLPPVTSPQIDAADAPAVISRLSAAIRALDLYRQQNLAESHKPLQLLLRRLVRVRSRFQKLTSG